MKGKHRGSRSKFGIGDMILYSAIIVLVCSVAVMVYRVVGNPG